MGIQSVLPVSGFCHFLVAILIIFVTVWARWIVDVVPILDYNGLLSIGLPLLLSASSLTFLIRVEAVDIVLVSISCPVRKRSFRRRCPSYWSQ